MELFRFVFAGVRKLVLPSFSLDIFSIDEFFIVFARRDHDGLPGNNGATGSDGLTGSNWLMGGEQSSKYHCLHVVVESFAFLPLSSVLFSGFFTVLA